MSSIGRQFCTEFYPHNRLLEFLMRHQKYKIYEKMQSMQLVEHKNRTNKSSDDNHFGNPFAVKLFAVGVLRLDAKGEIILGVKWIFLGGIVLGTLGIALPEWSGAGLAGKVNSNLPESRGSSPESLSSTDTAAAV